MLMTPKKLLPLIVAALALPAAAFAQITVVNFGESTTYVTASQNLAGGNGSFSTANISPAANYSGPTFWGGITYSVGGGAATWQLADNYSGSGGNDAIRGSRSSMVIGDSATYVFMFNGSQSFGIDNANSSFYLNARRDGGQNDTTTGLRWILRDTVGNYYVSALNNTAGAQFSGLYSGSSGVSQSSLVGLNWFSYTFASAAVGGSIADTADFFANTQFDAAGFQYVAKRVTSSGGLDMQFADFTVTAIPEPSSFAALAGLAGLGFVALRRRRRT